MAVAAVVWLALSFVDQDLNLTGEVLTGVSIAAKGIIFLSFAWAALLFFSALAESIIASPKARIAEDSIDATMWRIGASIAGFLAGAWILVAGLQSLGANVVPLLAGLGVGGLAVALAAQNTLTDIFGSLIILADRPYRIGHWVIIGDKEGTVESIGIRSTRIRTFYDSVLTIPNSEAVSKIIDNMGMRNYRRVYTKLGIRYDTPRERIEAFLEGVKRIIQANPTTRKDYFHVVFNDFGADSLTIMLYFFVKVPDWAAELIERQRVFLEVMRLAEELKIEFAFPTQTLEIETFPGQAGREPVAAASDDELRAIANRFAHADQSARPRGLGIFVPPHEEKED
jgi:MscS family membrane protein